MCCLPIFVYLWLFFFLGISSVSIHLAPPYLYQHTRKQVVMEALPEELPDNLDCKRCRRRRDGGKTSPCLHELANFHYFTDLSLF